jgi:hypothetical protein
MLMTLVACGGSLSDEQRKKIREEMAANKIRKVTESEITTTAFEQGRNIILKLEELENDSVRIDSLIHAEKGRVKWIVPGAATALALEQQLIDAYVAAGSGPLQDNVQLLRNAEGVSDSILYTKPVTSRLPDGREKLEGVWNIWLSKKQLILSMDKK